jgi:very-short-patch-repair endonuclease
MVFSVGYGRDENGKLTMNFGPLNREGGQRRLNVAITRARRRIELVASITGTEPEFTTNLREGPRHLQRYLDYAARGPVALAIDLSESALDAESPFEEEVMRTIRSWGYKVQPQVGTAGYRVDIGVWHPEISGRFALGIECDGRMYHSSAVARDRDRLRQEVLERLGWRIYRIWGTSWYRYRPEQEERLKTAIATAISETGTHQAAPPPKVTNSALRQEQSFEEVALDKAPSWTMAYRVASPAGPRPWVEMHLPEAQYDLRRMIVEVVEVEGPIEDELLLRRVREAWGEVGRAGSRIRDAFTDALESLGRRGLVSRIEASYTYARASQLQVVRVPGGNQLAGRSATQISRTEAKLAVQHIIADARRVSRDELTSEVSRLFGWNRRGADIATALNGAVDALVGEGLIVEDEGFLTVTARAQ